MKIYAVDVDGVVANNHYEWINLYNHDYHDNFTLDRWTSWNIHEFVKPECGMKIYDYLKDRHFYENVRPEPYSMDGITYLRRYGRVVFVTSSTPEQMGLKYQWLLKHKYLDNTGDYIECSDKSLVRADYLIDDKPQNIFDFDGTGVIFTQPWNKSIGFKYRISNWFNFVYSFPEYQYEPAYKVE